MTVQGVRGKLNARPTMTTRHLPSLALLASLTASLAACSPSTLAAESAEPMSCPRENIEIVESSQPMEGPASWTAMCTDPSEGSSQKWFCSRAGQRVICTEDPS